MSTSQASFPIYPGAYNYQKVALSNNPTTVYEVECYMSANQGSPNPATINGVNSLEYCIDQCTQLGQSGCTVAYWSVKAQTCQLYPNSATPGGSVAPGAEGPNSLIFGVRTARLLTSVAPNVVDATYLLAPGAQYNLGLCGGSAGNYYYDKTFIGVYHSDNTIRAGRADIWFVNCGGNTYYSSSIASSQLNSTQMTNVMTNTGFQNPPTTSDDCARLCAYTNVYAGDTTTNPLNCRLWHWTNANQCILFSSRGSQPSPLTNDNTILASGIYRGSTSAEYPLSQVASYKRSLPPGLGPQRVHARDALADGGIHVPDVIIPF
ncbi:hypothetical protein ABEF95_003432 [Exophiala dermatitidis]